MKKTRFLLSASDILYVKTMNALRISEKFLYVDSVFTRFTEISTVKLVQTESSRTGKIKNIPF